MTLVISDVDGILRTGKAPVGKDLAETIREFCQGRNELWLVTGAPASHVPDVVFHRAFAEFGTVEVTPERNQHILSPEAQQTFQMMRSALGLSREDGLDCLDDTMQVIIEGPRECSLTLLLGRPPHYPDFEVPWTKDALRAVQTKISQVVAQKHLSVRIQAGIDTTYGWVDIKAATKAETVCTRLPLGEKIYCADDTDLLLLGLEEVIPVGFANSIPAIRELSKKQGVFIDLPAAQGGMLKFLQDVNEGRL